MEQVTGNSIAETLGQLNSGIAAAVTVVGLVKTLRDMARAAHPTAPDGTFPSDDALITELASKSGLLKSEVADFRAWLKTQEQEAQTPPPPQQG